MVLATLLSEVGVPDAVVAWLLNQGWPGLVILILCGAVVYLTRDQRVQNAAVRQENAELREFIRDLQEQRVQELLGVADVSATAISNFTAKAEAILMLASGRGRK